MTIRYRCEKCGEIVPEKEHIKNTYTISTYGNDAESSYQEFDDGFIYHNNAVLIVSSMPGVMSNYVTRIMCGPIVTEEVSSQEEFVEWMIGLTDK